MREEEELPEGWSSRTLEELTPPDAPIQYGILQPGPDVPGGVPYVRPTEIRNDTIDAAALRRTSPAIATKYRRAALKGGDVLLSIVGSIGKVAVVPASLDGANITQSSARIRPIVHQVAPEFLAWFLRSPLAHTQFDDVQLGTGVPRLNIGDVRRFVMPLPSLLEQRRVVERIEHLSQSVTRAGDRLLKAASALRRFRQAVLAAACDGQLTSGWQGSRRGTPSSGDVDSPWPVVAAGSLFEVADYGTSVRCDRDVPEGIPVLRIPNIASGRLDISDLKFAPRKSLKAGEADVREGDILVCRTNGSLDLIGKAAVIRGLSRPHSFASYLIRLRVRGDSVLPDFFHLFLSSPAGRAQIERESRTTAGQYNLNLRILNELELPLPPLPEQHEIVRRVESLFALADAIEKRVASASARADKLTQAILAKAFRGELVPTEAELNRRREAAAATPPPAVRPTAARPAARRSR